MLMSPNSFSGWKAFLFLVALVVPVSLQAQPLVDGVSIGAGLSSYHGDLDWNPDNGPAEFLAAGNIGIFAAADRSFGPVIAESVLRYDRINIDYPLVDMTLNTVSLDLNAGIGFNVVRPLFFRVFAGVSPMLVMPSYDRVDQAALDQSILTFEQTGTHVALSFPVGIVIQDVLRLGVRFMPGDGFDGARGTSGSSDLLSFVSIGYRFDLLRP